MPDHQSAAHPGPRLAIAGALTLLLLAMPGAAGSVLSGSPLSAVGRWFLAALVASSLLPLAVPPVRAPRKAVLVALLVLAAVKLSGWLAVAPTGWRASIEALDSPAEQATFFWNFRPHSFRIDPEIRFTEATLGTHFLNNFARYRLRPWSSTSRAQDLPLRITWIGFASPVKPGELSLSIAANGEYSVFVNGNPVSSESQASETPREHRLRLPDAGELRLQITYDKPPGLPPEIAARARLDGTPLDVRPFSLGPNGSSSRNEWITRASDITVLFGGVLWVFTLVNACRHKTGRVNVSTATGVAAWAGSLIVLWVAARPALALTGQYLHLPSGDDPLAYVGNALDILHNGLLMNWGLPLGEGSAFYFYPLYSYFLAGVMAVVGEDLGAVRLANAFCLAAVPVLAYAFAFRRGPVLVAVAGQIAITVFVLRHCVRYATTGFSDNLFIALVFVCAIALWSVLEQPTSPRAFLLGLASAAAAATRPSFMTFVPMFVVLYLLWPPTESRRGRGRVVLAVVTGFSVGLLPFALRNWLVSGNFVLLVNSWIQIPFFLVPPEVPNYVPARLPGIPTLVDSLREAASIVGASPLGAMLLELRKLVFTVGVTSVGPGEQPLQPDLLVGTCLFVAALALRRIPAHVAAAIVMIGLSHVVAMVLAAPWTYGYKTILPLHALLLCGAAFLLPRRVDAAIPALGATTKAV